MSRPIRTPSPWWLLAALALAGCSTLPFRDHPSRHAPTTVRVENSRFEDLTVYLEREGAQIRLGTVPGKGATTLEVPGDFLSFNCWLRLVARSTGRETRAASIVFGIDPGSRVSWQIPLTSRETPVVVEPPAY